jgi:hypothetical protein
VTNTEEDVLFQRFFKIWSGFIPMKKEKIIGKKYSMSSVLFIVLPY